MQDLPWDDIPMRVFYFAIVPLKILKLGEKDRWGGFVYIDSIRCVDVWTDVWTCTFK